MCTGCWGFPYVDKVAFRCSLVFNGSVTNTNFWKKNCRLAHLIKHLWYINKSITQYLVYVPPVSFKPVITSKSFSLYVHMDIENFLYLIAYLFSVIGKTLRWNITIELWTVQIGITLFRCHGGWYSIITQIFTYSSWWFIRCNNNWSTLWISWT